jgi:hypothetical protein
MKLPYSFYSFITLFLWIIISSSSQSQTLYWQRVWSGDARDILIDKSSKIYIFQRDSESWYTWISTNLGTNWERRGNGNSPLQYIAKDSSGNLWAASWYAGGIYKSIDDGFTWTTSLSITYKIRCITVSPVNWIWAGTEDGKVVYSSDGGVSWEVDSIYNYPVTSIAANNLNQIFAGTHGNSFYGVFGKIFRSSNSGNTWEVCYDMHDLISIQSIITDDINNIYAAGINKIVTSTDNGYSWTTAGTGFLADDLFIDKSHYFYSGKHKSVDNCLSWSFIGPDLYSLYYNIAFKDSLVFSANVAGVYLYNPSYQPYVGKNYFPLMVGNKWQFIARCSQNSYSNSVCFVDRDTIFQDKRYYLLQGQINDWVFLRSSLIAMS